MRTTLLFLRIFLGVVGGVILACSLFSERLGLSGPGLPSRHPLLVGSVMLVGLAFLTASYALRLIGRTAWVALHAQRFAIVCIWMLALWLGLGGAEVMCRHLRGYAIWQIPLHKTNFIELDRLKVYNRRFYESKREEFGDWPIPIALFDSGLLVPRYLFKPDLRMARVGDRLVPAKPGDVIYWSSNAWGFRGPQFSVAKPPGVIRIVCLGASTTEGSQGDLDTYPHFLQQELIQSLPTLHFEVINAGHHGQTIDDLLEILRSRVLPLDPDIVFFYEVSNNIAFSDFLAPAPARGVRTLLFNWVSRYSAAFGIVSDYLGWMTDTPHRFDSSGPKPSVAHFKEVLAEIVRETKAHRSTIVLSSFVTLAQENLRISARKNPLMFRYIYRQCAPLTPGEIAQVYALFNQQSAAVAREFGVPYADIASSFPREEQFFPFDLIHFSPEGNQLLARLLASFLQAQILPHLTERKQLSGTRQ
jgi:lysophospholipase L1-like esterase